MWKSPSRPGRAWAFGAALILAVTTITAVVLSGGAARPAAAQGATGENIWTVVLDASWHKTYHGKRGGLSDIDETADYTAHVVQVYDGQRLSQMAKVMARATGERGATVPDEDSIGAAAIGARISATGNGAGRMHLTSRMGGELEYTQDWQGTVDPNLCMVQFSYPKAAPARATFLAAINFTGTSTRTERNGTPQRSPLGTSIGFPMPGISPANNAQSVPARSIQKTRNGYTVEWSFSEKGTTEGEQVAGEIHAQIIHGPLPETEAVIAVDDAAAYKKWLPKGGPLTAAGAGQRGNTLSATIYLRNKKTKKPVSDVAFTAKCRLVNVSHQPGVCVNFPVRRADTLPDLRFDSADNPRAGDVSGDGLSLETKKRSGAHDVTVTCYDYGAWGELTAKVTTEKGDVLDAVLDTDSSRRSLSIPLDDNGNHVADAWETEQGVLGKNLGTTWDEDDQPSGQRRNGDGYTLYEEYRGFNTLNGYVRTSPTHKDVFVWDKSGLVKQYYDHPDPESGLSNPSGITLHYVDDTMMRFNGLPDSPENRWVNVNSTPETMYARQYGIYILADDSVDANGKKRVPDSGGANPISVDKAVYVFDQPLKTFFEIRISPANVFGQFHGAPDFVKKCGEIDMLCTVVHEMGHAMGITHHLPPDQEKDRVVNENGAVGTGETYDSQRGGVLTCPMRYYNPQDLASPEKLMPRVHYCRAGEKGIQIQIERKPRVDKNGNPVIENGEPVIDDVGMKILGDCPSNNCWHKIDVKSDP